MHQVAPALDPNFIAWRLFVQVRFSANWNTCEVWNCGRKNGPPMRANRAIGMCGNPP